MRYLCLVVLLLLMIAPIIASAQVSYEVEDESVVLEIEESGDVLLSYNLTIHVTSGTVARYVAIGMPNSRFDVMKALEMRDGEAREVEYEKVIEESYYAVKMHPTTPINAGESRTYHLEVVLKDFIYEDSMNPGNVGLEFIPSWFDARVRSLRLWIILPPGVDNSNKVRNRPDYDNLILLEDGRLALYWERHDLPPSYKFDVGVSFPKEYVRSYVKGSESEGLLPAVIGLIFLGAVVFSIFFIASTVKSLIEKSVYKPPEVSVESLGVNKNLRPPEVAYLKKLEGREISYGRILATIALELSNKGLIRVKSVEPLDIEKLNNSPSQLRAYEKIFLDCLDGGTPSEDCLVNVIKSLHRRVNREIAGYSRLGTVAHYEKLVNSIWREISRAPMDKRLEILRENLPWLLTDENFERNLKRYLKEGLSPDQISRPLGGTWPLEDTWIWIPRGGTIYIPHPREPIGPKDIGGRPEARSGVEAPVVSIERAADSIARSIEGFSSSIVRNMEDFSNKIARTITPERPRGSSRRHVLSCVCVSCACACACVSCACACAGGGVG